MSNIVTGLLPLCIQKGKVMHNTWYHIENIETVDSPSIVLYKEHLAYNIGKMVSLVDGQTDRLMPHIKTNKMPKVMQLMLESGIQ